MGWGGGLGGGMCVWGGGSSRVAPVFSHRALNQRANQAEPRSKPAPTIPAKLATPSRGTAPNSTCCSHRRHDATARHGATCLALSLSSLPLTRHSTNLAFYRARRPSTAADQTVRPSPRERLARRDCCHHLRPHPNRHRRVVHAWPRWWERCLGGSVGEVWEAVGVGEDVTTTTTTGVATDEKRQDETWWVGGWVGGGGSGWL